jgi:hypothetical protein
MTSRRSTRAWREPWAWIAGAVFAAAAVIAGLNVLYQVPQPDAVSSMPVRHVRDPEAALLDVKDGGCVTSADILYVTPDLTAVDARLTVTPWLRGWIGGVYYGTLEEAVRAMGGTEIAIGPNEIWFKTGPTTAESINSLRTPLGRVVWMRGNATSQTGCAAP